VSTQDKIAEAAAANGWDVKTDGGNFAWIRRGVDEVRVKYSVLGSVSWADISVALTPAVTTECRDSLPPRSAGKSETIMGWLRDGAPRECQ
jgi:hypothetical protein